MIPIIAGIGVTIIAVVVVVGATSAIWAAVKNTLADSDEE